MSLPEYFARYNPELLRWIPPDAKVVLEIGCGTGKLCEMYRRVNPRVEWHGVEANPEAAKAARAPGRCDTVKPTKAEATNYWGDGSADCLILGDILEHIVGPWELIEFVVKSLAPGAQVLASIPNVGHWTVIRDLLAGKWEYADEGLLDRTHLRFFTRSSIKAMFEAAGLHVFEMRGRDLYNEGVHEFVAKSGVKLDKEALAYQYIVRALKPHDYPVRTRTITTPEHGELEMGNIYGFEPLHIHAILAEGCCSRPRILEPFAMIETIPGVRCTTGDLGLMSPHILIQQRLRSINTETQSDIIRSGTAAIVIAEIDDLPEAIGVDPICLKAVHAIQTTTERMAETLREFNPNVFVFPNQIASIDPFPQRTEMEFLVTPEGRICNPNVEKPPDAKWIPQVSIFYGAQNRQSDWKPIMASINRIIADHPTLTFQVIHDREFYDALETDRKSFEPFCEYLRYKGILRTCDIALLPLEPTQFNEHKSDLKFLECAAEGVSVLMSEFAAEHLSEPHPNDAYRCYGTPERFEWLMRDAIKQRVEWNWTTDIAYRHVRDHRLLSQHYRRLYDWYRSLLTAKPVLDRQLRARCPELFDSELPQFGLQATCSEPP